ncbi:MAG: sigma-70 family RNA polymerase sigma factor [Bacteroidales bacterium]|nr:sigma-70 family RNA polymerase sigma factor [Bacteroidales bacterium]
MDLERFQSDIVSLRQILFFTALKYMEDEEEAEDIVQETLLRLWTMRDQLDAISNTGSYSVQITKNICIDRIRAQKETVDARDHHFETNTQTPYGRVETENAIDIVKKIIESLPGLQKQIITMRDIEGYELQEIANITGTQISAVTVNLSRARKRVRDLFKQINEYKMKYECK